MPLGIAGLQSQSVPPQGHSDTVNADQDTTNAALGISTGGAAATAPQTLREQLMTNPLLTAGVGVVGLTAALAIARKSFAALSSAVVQHYLITLEIPIRDQSYPWFLHWMQHHQRQIATATASTYNAAPMSNMTFLKSPTQWAFERIRPRSHHISVATVVETLPNGSFSTSFSLFPGIGNHIFRYKSAFMKMSRTRELKNLDPNGIPWEVVSLTTLYSKRHLFTELLSEAQQLAVKSQEGKTVIYTSHMTDWRKFGQARKKRPLESVVLDEGVKERIVDDVRDFLMSSKWYTDRGIPYRRGYLLHGPPGSGKSSFIQALAGELDYNICLVNLSERGLTDDRLNHLLSNIPTRSLVLLEDVDAAFNNRKQADETGYAGANVTFSGLLNALDGVASSEERILFLTTNHVEVLDPALVRPGRVDMEMRIDLATEWQVARMFERFYGDEQKFEHGIEGLRDEFIRELREGGAFASVQGEGSSGISTAQLQGLFVYYKYSPEEAVKNANLLLPANKR